MKQINNRTNRDKAAKVVIGANYGDEAKGGATDTLCAASSNPLVVRFNGGAQAGHTVTTADGRRHVFSHFGSGTFVGAPTFLSRFFVVLPRIFVRELAELEALGEHPEITCDPNAQVTTPFDVGLNRAVEMARGGGRHGSVGVGFGETIERAENGFGLAAKDLSDEAGVRHALARIAAEWLPRRLAKLGLAANDDIVNLVASPAAIASWREEVNAMMKHMTPASLREASAGHEVVFEGAQGLLLDMDRGHQFPFVTRSNTGLKNVLTLASDAGIENLDVTYMTRAYLTRHGAGPLRNERESLEFAEIVDPTNRPNAWQGTLRFAPLDLDVLRETIAADLSDAEGTAIAAKASVGVSCADQIRRRAVLIQNGRPIEVPRSAIGEAISSAVKLPLSLESWGPTRQSATTQAGAAA